MSRISFKVAVFLCAGCIVACKSYYPFSGNASLVAANKAWQEDTAVKHFYQPYKDSLDNIMKVPVAELETDLVKKLPESTLGNFMVDILKAKTEAYTGDTIDVAILNYGGIRSPSLSKGTLRVEHAYLLMPFDNYLVEQVLTGRQLNDFCDSIAVKKGWPVSGISFTIRDGKAEHILVQNQPLDVAKKYKVALIDYVANGGDGMAFLKFIPQKQTGVLFRDAILEFWKEATVRHQPLSAKIENRITYAQ
jgi:2',3'-cyclic-nucleotide 2'-phosphodiesterase (5'-nucleotidase family)